MRLKSALRRGVAAAVIAGIVVSSGIPVYAKTWDIASGDITVKGASDESGNYNEVKQGDKGFEKDEGETVITGKSKEHTVTIDTSKGNVDVTFDDLKIDVSGKAEVDGSGKAEGDVSDKTEVDGGGDSPVRESNAAVTVKGDHDATIELDGKNELKSGSKNAGLEKNDERSEDGKTISGKLTIKDDKGKDGSLTAAGGAGAGIGGKHESGAGNIEITGGTIKAEGGEGAAGIGGGVYGIGHDIEISGGKVSATGGNANKNLESFRTGAAGIGDGAEQPLRDLLQQRIADRVAHRVVDRLEPVEVEQEQRGAVIARLRQRLFQRQAHPLAIGEAGQAVEQRGAGDRRIRLPHRRHVGTGADEPLEPAIGVGERAARYGPVALALPRRGGGDGVIGKGGARRQVKGDGPLGIVEARFAARDSQHVDQRGTDRIDARRPEHRDDLVAQIGQPPVPIGLPEPVGTVVFRLVQQAPGAVGGHAFAAVGPLDPRSQRRLQPTVRQPASFRDWRRW